MISRRSTDTPEIKRLLEVRETPDDEGVAQPDQHGAVAPGPPHRDARVACAIQHLAMGHSEASGAPAGRCWRCLCCEEMPRQSSGVGGRTIRGLGITREGLYN